MAPFQNPSLHIHHSNNQGTVQYRWEIADSLFSVLLILTVSDIYFQVTDYVWCILSLLQVFQVKKMSGTDTGKIFAMKVLKKVSQYSGI